MEFGVTLPNSGPFAAPQHITAVAHAADDLGFDSVWVHDHITRSVAEAEFHFVAGAWEAWQRPIVPNVFEALTTLAFVAGITRRVRLGSAIIVLPYRNPVWLAKMAATIDQFSDGRLILGTGAGGSAYVKRGLAAMGGQALTEALGTVANDWLDIIRAVWKEPKLNMKTDFLEVQDAEVFPKPLQQPGPPIWIGGFSKPAMRRVVTRGDGWMPIYLTVDEYREGRGRVLSLAAQAGRDPASIKFATEHWLCIDRDGDRAQREALATTKGMGDFIATVPGAGRDSTSLRGTEEQTSIVGNQDAVAARIAAYRQAGAEYVILRFIADSIPLMLERMQLFAETVMPQFVGVTTAPPS